MNFKVTLSPSLIVLAFEGSATILVRFTLILYLAYIPFIEIIILSVGLLKVRVPAFLSQTLVAPVTSIVSGNLKSLSAVNLSTLVPPTGIVTGLSLDELTLNK